ncbi:MAG: sortase [Candidatus Peribacteraceae bacterium]|jgi:LPXTG-site transpeptidase (sortase) family protein
MKNHPAALLIAILALSWIGQATVSAAAPGDTQGTRYAQAYAALQEKGALGNTGRPYDRITRVEALKVIVALRPHLKNRAQWFANNLPPLPLFPDLDQHAWYAPYVEAAFEAGIITGYPDRSFRPTATVRAEEGIVMLQRAYGEDTPRLNAGPEEAPFGGKAWYANAVAKAFSRNVVASSEKLRLGSALTRGQFIDMAYRQDEVTTRKLTAFTEPVWTSPASPRVAAVPAPASPVIRQPSVATITPPPVAAVVTVPSLPRPPNTSVAQPVPRAETVSLSAKPFAITIPTLEINDLSITHPADPTTQKGLLAVLANGVGHLFSYPGGEGKIMIYGHSSGYSWDVSKFTKAFRQINKLNKGDRVYVTHQGVMHVYEVTYKHSVPVNDLQYFSGQGEELILYTCWPPDSIKERYLVHAVPVNSVAKK